MSDALKYFKEQEINRYISDVLSEGYIDVSKIRRELKRVLGEEPAIELNYEKEKVLNEDGSETSSIERLSSVTVYYTYDDGNEPRFGKLDYYP